MTDLPSLIDHFGTLAPHYDVVLSDVWGVVHNGVAAYPEASDALTRFRRGGGTVVLISNSPRPGDPIRHQLDQFGVARTAYDAVVTSGDVTRAELMRRPGARVFHIGPERDLPIFTGLEITFTPLEQADCVVCSGLFDDLTETPDDYADLLGKVRARELLMICANPDLIVERGHELLYCAGSLADLYGAMGGTVVYAGKPHRPIYDLALGEAAARRDTTVDINRVLAIGDSVRTDFKGAQAVGIDCLFVTAGIHAGELGHRDDPDLAALAAMFAAGEQPKAVTRRLAW